jgi:hypothetical protein
LEQITPALNKGLIAKTPKGVKKMAQNLMFDKPDNWERRRNAGWRTPVMYTRRFALLAKGNSSIRTTQNWFGCDSFSCP